MCPYIIDFPGSSLLKNAINRRTMILDMDPVPDIKAIPVYRNFFPVEAVEYCKRD
jgi:hypothetical protein